MRTSLSRTLSLETTLVWFAGAALIAACGNSMPPADAGSDAGAPDVTHVDVADVHTADVHPDVRPTGCRAATTCSACAAMNTSSITCGWSIAQSACLQADSSEVMSGDGSSTGPDWAPFAAQCPGSTMCAASTDCVSCDTTNNGCGWCNATNQCMIGIVGADGSQDGTCAPADWGGDGTQCSGAVAFCAGHGTSCSDCTMTPFCGVCSGTTDCLPGTATGPLMGSTQLMCAGGAAWAWLSTDCASYDAGPGDTGTPDATSDDALPPDDAGPPDDGGTSADGGAPTDGGASPSDGGIG